MKNKILSSLVNPGAFILCATVSCATIYFCKSKLNHWPAQLRILTPPTPKIKKFTFGYDPLIADLMWLRTVQDIHYCQDHKCEGQWTFKMLDIITDLAPHFRAPYSIGSLSLSLLSNDTEGASKLFDKAMAGFPDDWTYPYRAGYHAMFNENKKLKAANLFKLAAEKGAPAWVYSLATRNYIGSGRMALAQGLLRSLKAENVPQSIIDRVKKRIETRNSGQLVDPKHN